MPQVGLYGGSFNPIHIGHLRTALEVHAAARLDSVWLIPAHQPPHKHAAEIAPARDRLAMVEAAVENVPELRVEPIELERSGPSYSIDTVRILRERNPGTEFRLILGFDAFRDLHTWSRYEELIAECDLLVTTRPPDPVFSGPNPQLLSKLPIAVTRDFRYENRVGCYTHASGRRLEFLPVTQLDISSSALRADVARGNSIRFLVPDAVDRYIRNARLYEKPSAAPTDGAD